MKGLYLKKVSRFLETEEFSQLTPNNAEIYRVEKATRKLFIFKDKLQYNSQNYTLKFAEHFAHHKLS